MKNQIVLSDRLENIKEFIIAGASFADIGSDHAYLPIAVCLLDSRAHAIAGEVNEGPYRAAINHVEKYELSDRIKVVKADGLKAIESVVVDQVVIAGMGGGLIRSILDRDKSLLAPVKRLILQPNLNSHLIREWLIDTDYELVFERILKEDGHIYEILVADKVTSIERKTYSAKELLFGPYLLKDKNAIFKDKWEIERQNIERILEQVKKAKQTESAKINQFKMKLKWIEEVLKDD